jgi:hypothetical protein
MTKATPKTSTKKQSTKK